MIANGWLWGGGLGGLVIYWRLPRRSRAGFLVLLSGAFIAWFDRRAVAAVLLAGGAVLALQRIPVPHTRRILGGLAVGIGFCFLAFTKLQHLSAGHILGLSYLCFKSAQVILDQEEVRPVELFAFLASIPTFLAGPIERFERFTKSRTESFSRELFTDGGTRIVYGLAKKFLLADALLLPWHDSMGVPERVHSSSASWLLVGSFFLYSYFEFSGYSDLAIGASRLFGYRVCENFHWPLLSPNLGEFWRRWHISLGAWCRAYVYTPVMANTRSPFLGLYLSMIVFGLWHGVGLNMLAWGLYQATGLALYAWFSRLDFGDPRPDALPAAFWRFAGMAATLCFVTAGYSFILTANRGVGQGHRIVAATRLLGQLLGFHG